MKAKRLTLLFALCVTALPALAVFNGDNLGQTLSSLRQELQRDYLQMAATRYKLANTYEDQHRRMIDIIKESNELSLMLYSQKQNFTFDLSYALEKVTKEYEAFNKDRMPYDRILTTLDVEIDRHARLLESLRRLPPEMLNLDAVPDSLAYHNDTLDQQTAYNQAMQVELDELIDTILLNKGIEQPFVLDEAGREDRDSCIFYAAELLKMYAGTRALVVADSIHYREAYLRLKESYDYARGRYQTLQRRIFIDGQTPWPVILSDPARYWADARNDFLSKFGLARFAELESLATDSLVLARAPADPDARQAYLDSLNAARERQIDEALAIEKGESYTMQLIKIVFLTVILLMILAAVSLLLLPVFHFVRPLREKLSHSQRYFITLLVAILVFILINTGYEGSDMLEKIDSLANTFLWLLAAIYGALLIRLPSDQLRNGVRLYRPTILMALFVMGFRVLFIPNSVLNFLFPPLLAVFFIWQLITCARLKKKVEKSDIFFSRISLLMTGIALVLSLSGFIFLSLLILVWWYFQLAAIHTMATVWHLAVLYRDRYMDNRIAEYRKSITYVTGKNRETLLFGATWLYDLVREVVLPVMGIISIPFCLRLSLNVFDFRDLFELIYVKPFFVLTNAEGVETLRLSFRTIIQLFCLFFVFKYLDKAIHAVWQYARYDAFLRKYNRKSIRNNEINLSLGNSIISVLVWGLYIAVIIVTLRVPTGTLGLIAGGLSAGVGIALKDIINNFVYGIQLMSGRLRVGDWIECDGIRGKVTDINYQSTLVETVDGTQVAFLNASLFGKNFNNLTRNDSYEFTKIIVGVAYGTDVQRVREVLVEAMQVLRTKDRFGREIVEPGNGIYVVVGDMSDSSVDIAVKQYVLVAERIGYIDRAKEVIYNALNANGIRIPFPQCDVHLVQDEG